MKHFTRHKPSGTRAERSIFGTIFNAMVGVLLVEVTLLVASVYAMRVGPQLDQNAEDILAMQVENRSRYIQTTLNDAQELSTLESQINAALKGVRVSQVKSKTVSRNGAEMTIELRVEKQDALVNRLLAIEGVQDATLVAYQPE